nr:SURF1 family protein [Salsipaludibacter albus]
MVTFPMLGLWQWDRYQQEQAVAAAQSARLDAAPVPLAQVLGPSVTEEQAATLEYTPVTVSGTWAADEQVAQRNRDLDGQLGFDLLAPLELGDGTAVLVRRGFVPPDGPSSADPTADTPIAGTVTVTGFLEVSGRQPEGLGARDADDGVLSTVFHADVDRLDRQSEADLLPMVVHLTSQVPSDGPLPVPQPAPTPDPTQNLSYTLQWFAFTVIVGVGYAFVLVRRVRDHRDGVDSDVDPLLRDRDPR